ncbi:MAG TPA: ABC transporter permease [Blastocatellia bacterium]|nr:ABC transporter permease [Blastocatellia bacterium]
MRTFWQDLRYGARMLLKKPGFTLIAVLTLALGIGANTAIFSVVNGVLLKPLPYREPEQLIRVFERSRTQPKFPMSGGNFQDYRDQNSTLSGLALYTRQDLELSQDDKPERLAALRVSAGFFELLGARPLLGREFRREDELPDNNQVVILSHGLWKRRFNSDPGVIGRVVTLLGRPFTIVGVAPPGLQHVGGDYRSMPHGESVDAWWPVALRPQAGRGAHFLNAVGRLKSGVSVAQAEADFTVIAERLAQQFPNTNQGWRIAIQPLQEEIAGRARTTLLALFGAVFFVLLIACVNVANLLLARATTREREIAVRAAVGAGRGRIVRQLLTESLLLAMVGGVAGIMLAQWAIDALKTLGPEQLPRLQAVSIDGRILLFTLGVTLLTGVLFGLAPALQAGQVNLNELLKEGGRGGGGQRRRLRDALVITEVALALALLVGAGLLIRSFWRLQRVDPGFNPERVLTASLTLPGARYGDPSKLAAFHQQLLERVTALPGAQSAGLTSDLPWTGYDENQGPIIEGKTFPPNDGPSARYHYVSPDYFRTIGVPLTAGRFFNADDRRDTQRVVLINRSMAERYWPGESAVGKRIAFSSQPKESDWFMVVGVVGDVKDFPHSPAAEPAFYWSTTQLPISQFILAVRSGADPLSLLEAVRGEVRALDKDLPLAYAQSLETIAAAAVAGRRFTLWLVGFFALTAMSLAAIGIYSVLSYLVAQRSHEIGLRMALGAQLGDVLKLVIRQGMTLVLLGLALGLGAALALTRLIKGLLFEISATDPLAFALAAALLAVVALLACYIPAWRATRVDPMVALKFN